MDKEPDIVDRLIAAQLPICFEAAQLITWIRQERDEARREAMLLLSDRASTKEMNAEYKKRGWEYLKEER